MREAARRQTTTVSGRGKEGRREEEGREGREGGREEEGREGGKEGRGREWGKRVGATPTGISALRSAVEVLPRHPGTQLLPFWM